jgi:hypothetical protein
MTNLSGQRILVVEDSWHLGVALKSLLRSVGAEVAGPVATSAEAERLIAEQVPDAAIVDFNLRGGELAFDLIDKLSSPVMPLYRCLQTRWRPFCKSQWSKSSFLRLCRSRDSRIAAARSTGSGAGERNIDYLIQSIGMCAAHRLPAPDVSLAPSGCPFFGPWRAALNLESRS